jgi:hypothetical protein
LKKTGTPAAAAFRDQHPRPLDIAGPRVCAASPPMIAQSISCANGPNVIGASKGSKLTP